MGYRLERQGYSLARVDVRPVPIPKLQRVAFLMADGRYVEGPELRIQDDGTWLSEIWTVRHGEIKSLSLVTSQWLEMYKIESFTVVNGKARWEAGGIPLVGDSTWRTMQVRVVSPEQVELLVGELERTEPASLAVAKMLMRAEICPERVALDLDGLGWRKGPDVEYTRKGYQTEPLVFSEDVELDSVALLSKDGQTFFQNFVGWKVKRGQQLQMLFRSNDCGQWSVQRLEKED